MCVCGGGGGGGGNGVSVPGCPFFLSSFPFFFYFPQFVLGVLSSACLFHPFVFFRQHVSASLCSRSLFGLVCLRSVLVPNSCPDSNLDHRFPVLTELYQLFQNSFCLRKLALVGTGCRKHYCISDG